MDKIRPEGLAERMRQAHEMKRVADDAVKIADQSLADNEDILRHEAHRDYLQILNQRLAAEIKSEDREAAFETLGKIFEHKTALAEIIKDRPDIEEHVDRTSGEVDMEKFEKQMNAFMKETLTVWYGKDAANEAKIKMLSKPLAEMDYEAMRRNDPSKFGEYTMNSDRTGADYIEKKEIPKTKILNEELKQFIGKPISEVMKFVSETYGGKYRIPDMEDEQYILSLPADQVPKELKDGNYYYLPCSVLRFPGGRANVPGVCWDGGRLDRRADRLDRKWDDSYRVLLLEK